VVPSLSWRLDKHWNRMRDEVPHVKRPPSEYIKEHIWFSTQPMEEPPDRQDLKTLIDWIGWIACCSHRLSALGFRRSELRLQIQDERRTETDDLRRER